MHATLFASVPQIQLGNDLLDFPSHNTEIALPAAVNIVAAAK